jgi:hypothetical protein
MGIITVIVGTTDADTAGIATPVSFEDNRGERKDTAKHAIEYNLN